MNFIQLEYFKKVAECKNISVAAKKLFVSQPAISKQLKLLEDELECRLFFRRKNHLVLTDEGELLWEHAKNIISQVNNIPNELNYRRNKVSGKLIIGCGSFTARSILPEILEVIIRDYPEIKPVIFETEWSEMRELLENDSIDIGFGPELTGIRNKVKFEEILASNLVFICSSKSMLSGKKKITYEDIQQAPLVTYTSDSVIYKNLEATALFEKSKIILQTRHTETIITYVEKNIGVGIVPEYILNFRPGNNIVVKKLASDIKIRIGLNLDNSKPLSPAAKVFIETVKQKYAGK